MKGQMLLDLGHRPALGRDDFLVGESNRAAVAWVDAWPDWRVPGIVLHGPAQCGKTHLAEVWRTRSNASVVEAASLTGDRVPELLGAATAVVLEAADRARDERAVLHFYNQLVERGGHMLMTAATPPNRWNIGLSDLRSRLVALPAVGLGPPDDRLFEAILIKLFADRQVLVPADVINYLAARLERSIAAAAIAVAALDRGALAARRPINVAMVRKVLKLHDPA